MSYKIPHLGIRMVRERTLTLASDSAHSANDVAAIATKLIGDRPVENLIALCVDGRGCITAMVTVATGGMHGLGARPVDVLRAVLATHASAFILSHNHPSNDPTPSAEDIAFTRKLVEAANVIGLPMLDHVIVTRSGGFASVPFT